MSKQHDFRVRAVTSFLTLKPEDFHEITLLQSKIATSRSVLKLVEQKLVDAGYEVQTLRIATNPFGEYLAASEPERLKEQLSKLDEILKENSIEFCALGPATSPQEVDCCPIIVSTSHRLSSRLGTNSQPMGLRMHLS